MKYVTPPVIDHRAHYQTCVRQTRDNAVKALLLSMTSRVVRAGESYGVAAAAGNLHTVKKMPATSGESRWLSQVYDRRMVPRTGSGRAVYEEI